MSYSNPACVQAVAEAAANLAEIALRATQGDPGMNAIAEDAAKLAIQVAGAVPSRKPDTVQPFRPGTGASIPAQRTGTPKFRGYSPLIHIVQGAPPSTASRPSTNPITHALQGDALAEAARESLSRGLSRYESFRKAAPLHCSLLTSVSVSSVSPLLTCVSVSSVSSVYLSSATLAACMHMADAVAAPDWASPQ